MPIIGGGTGGDTVEAVDGFEDYATSQVLRCWAGYCAPSGGVLAATALDGSCAVVAGIGRDGGHALRFTAGNRCLRLALPRTATRLKGVAFRVDRIAPSVIASFLDGSAIQCALRLDAAGTLSAARGDGTVIGTSARAIAAGAWYHLQVGAAISGAGMMTLVATPDGSTWLSAAGSTTTTGNPYCDGIAIGPHDAVPGVIAWDYDDFYSDGAGTGWGDCSVISSLPAAEGASAQWARGGTDTGANHSQVSDNPADDDATYIVSADPGGALDLYGYAGTPTGGAAIVAVAAVAVARAAAGAENLTLDAHSGGIEHDGATQPVASASYLAYPQVWGSDPATRVAWSNPGLAAAQFGPRLLP